MWEEIVLHAEELAGRRVRLVIITDEAQEIAGTTKPKGEEHSLAEMFAGRTGRFRFGPSDLSEKTEEAFGEIVTKKYRKQGLSI